MERRSTLQRPGRAVPLPLLTKRSHATESAGADFPPISKSEQQ